jgi:RsiW-degrading membrane proteinase PrsW (M82 family)
MSQPCRICQKPGTHQLGAYLFCDTHYERACRQRGGVWQADVASIGLLLLFVLLIFGLERWLQPQFSTTSLLVTGVLIAIIPAAVWLFFFYRRDRLEPEPKHMVFRLFLLGALLASAVGMPVLDNLFAIPDWLYSSPVWAHLLGSFLLVGFVQEFLVYTAVRFTVYSSQEFDEATDGIVYATAAGIGYATLQNIVFVIASGGVALGTGSVYIVLNTLAHASFAGVIGYFLGRQKFEERPLWWMPVGLTAAAALNASFFYFRGTLTQASFGAAANQWLGLLLATILAGVVTWFLSRFIQRNLATLLAQEEV